VPRIEVVNHCGLAKLRSVKFGMRGLPADDAGLKLAAEQLNSERIERGSNGGNLIQDIDAIPILLDHVLDRRLAHAGNPHVYKSPFFWGQRRKPRQI
jgi:hypothetical protein